MSYTYFPELPKGEWNTGEPHLNVANGNAHIPAIMMGIPFENYHVSPHELDAALASVEAQCEADYMKPTTESGGPGTGMCLVIDCGRSCEQIAHYKARLIELIKFCQERKTYLRWG